PFAADRPIGGTRPLESREIVTRAAQLRTTQPSYRLCGSVDICGSRRRESPRRFGGGCGRGAEFEMGHSARAGFTGRTARGCESPRPRSDSRGRRPGYAPSGIAWCWWITVCAAGFNVMTDGIRVVLVDPSRGSRAALIEQIESLESVWLAEVCVAYKIAP